MSGVVYRFDNGPILRHLAKLEKLGKANFAAAKREIGEYFVGEIQDAFDFQRLFDGSAMPQSKAAIERKGKTLLKDRHLYMSYTHQPTRDGLEIGSNKVYAAVHHFGGKAGRGLKVTLPARPVMGMTPEHRNAIGDILIDEIRRAQA